MIGREEKEFLSEKCYCQPCEAVSVSGCHHQKIDSTLVAAAAAAATLNQNLSAAIRLGNRNSDPG